MGWAMCLIWTMGLLFAAASAGASGVVHKVGDSAGWTLRVPVDYAKWASSQTFHVGDSLLFSYNNSFHNVLEVDRQQFETCNASSPAATYSSGADSIALKRSGTFYFLCGIPGHCEKGQKVEIKVTRASSTDEHASSPGPSPSPRPGPGPSPLPNGPTPPGNTASTLHQLSLLLLGASFGAFYHLCV